jgi:hypothetical protein
MFHGEVATMSPPGSGALLYQSAKPSVARAMLPSV